MRSRAYVHPFPARMAPEIALGELNRVPRGSVVLDPMAGSGTVLQEAAKLGLRAIGIDLDPLAVRISHASFAAASHTQLYLAADHVAAEARAMLSRKVHLPWIDEDEETKGFISFWFARNQRRHLRRLAYSLRYGAGVNYSLAIRTVLEVALSRLIVTKQRGASLAWDVSHSRPHRVLDENDFNVLDEFMRACDLVVGRQVEAQSVRFGPRIHIGDARKLTRVGNGSVDVVLTSPPYLNAIDYMRGHRLALVWLGYTISRLRNIRARSIGSERMLIDKTGTYAHIVKAFGVRKGVDRKLHSVLMRYARDMVLFFNECDRVLRDSGKVHLVVGESRIGGSEILTSKAVTRAAELAGFRLTEWRKRKIVRDARYLPVTQRGPLSKRMLSEVVLTYARH
ncbi:MAG: DNA methyltransferase [Dehalococcoidia bacterium]